MIAACVRHRLCFSFFLSQKFSRDVVHINHTPYIEPLIGYTIIFTKRCLLLLLDVQKCFAKYGSSTTCFVSIGVHVLFYRIILLFVHVRTYDNMHDNLLVLKIYYASFTYTFVAHFIACNR